jgi:hypothetical protein
VKSKGSDWSESRNLVVSMRERFSDWSESRNLVVSMMERFLDSGALRTPPLGMTNKVRRENSVTTKSATIFQCQLVIPSERKKRLP